MSAHLKAATIFINANYDSENQLRYLALNRLKQICQEEKQTFNLKSVAVSFQLVFFANNMNTIQHHLKVNIFLFTCIILGVIKFYIYNVQK
jgi:hypothetical protein